MGRVSKRKSSQVTKNAQTSTTIKYNVGIYARLSSDSDEGKNESIDSQIDIIKGYIQKQNRTNESHMEIFDIYQDLGKTGTNFSRDEFARLMQDVRLRDVNCVIVKDLSRFGRNYLEAGNYIEKIFPFLGVRFIAVTDGFDTEGNNKNNSGLSLEIKNLVNDMYAKDLSKKASIHLQQRREQGSYVGGPVPYGYESYWDNKIRKLKVDDEVAPIIRLIFETFLKEKNYTIVTNRLNELRVNPPVEYKKSKEVYYIGNQYKGWDKSAVTRILTSPTYIGNLEQGKTSIIGGIEADRVRKPQKEWVVKKKNHEPIITDDSFQEAQEIIALIRAKIRSNKRVRRDIPLEENIFDKVIYCGVCGKKLTRETGSRQYKDGRIERTEAYSCIKNVKGKYDNCEESNRITKQALLKILIPALRMEFATYLENSKKYVAHGTQLIEELEAVHSKRIRDINLSIERVMEEDSNSYIRYREELLSQEDYLQLKIRNMEKVKQLNSSMEEAVACKKNVDKVSKSFAKSIRSLIRLKESDDLNKEMVESLIDRIYLYPDKRVEIIYKYTDDILKGVK